MPNTEYFKYSFKVTGDGHGSYVLGAKTSGPNTAYYVKDVSDGGQDDTTQIGDIEDDKYVTIDSNNGPNGNPVANGVFVSHAPDGDGFVGQFTGNINGPVVSNGQQYLYTNDTTYQTGDTLSGFVACYATGTLIRTASGDVAIEALAIGDHVITASGAARPIKWIGRRAYAGRFANANPHVLPVRINAGALADGAPGRDLVVSPKHAMFVDGVLIAAELLVNGVSVTKASRIDEITYWHLELDSHDVLIAEGAASESFVDDDSRGMFQNAADFAELYPHEVRTEAVYCAPRVTDGYTLDAVRRRIDARAGLPARADDAGPLSGAVDAFDGETVSGWARNDAYPGAAVCLDVLIDGRFAGRTLANRERAGQSGSEGRHAFAWRLPIALDRSAAPCIAVRRSCDGAPLAHAEPVAAMIAA